MAPSRTDIIEVCTHLAAEENLQVLLSEAAKGAACAGISAFVGALVAGPLGLAVGGTIGSVAGGIYGRGKYKSVAEVIKNDMSAQQRARLADSIMGILQNVQASDVIFIISILSSNQPLRELVIKEIGSFLLNELRLPLV